MSLLRDAKPLFSMAQAEGRINKLHKLIQLDQESLSRPDGFLNRHEKIEARLVKYYSDLKEAEQNFRNVMDNIVEE